MALSETLKQVSVMSKLAGSAAARPKLLQWCQSALGLSGFHGQISPNLLRASLFLPSGCRSYTCAFWSSFLNRGSVHKTTSR